MAVEIEGAAADVGHEEPGADGADGAHGGLADANAVGRRGLETDLFHEVDSGTDHGGTTGGLDQPDDTGDLGSSEIDTLEAINVSGASALLDLEFIGMDHHRQGIFDVEIGVVLGRGKSQERMTRFVELAVSNQPPWRLWSEESSDHDWNRPNPLDCVRNSVGPFCRVGDEASQNTGRKQLTDNPAEVDVGGKIRAKSDRGDLGSVSGSQGLEHAPRKATQDVAGEKHLDVDL